MFLVSVIEEFLVVVAFILFSLMLPAYVHVSV